MLSIVKKRSLVQEAPSFAQKEFLWTGLRGWLMVSIIGRRGRASVGKLSIVKPDESTWQVFQSSEFFLRHRRLVGILWASLQRRTLSCPSEKEMTNAHKGLQVSLKSLMAFSWLWHPSPVSLLGRMWFSSLPRAHCGFLHIFFLEIICVFNFGCAGSSLLRVCSLVSRSRGYPSLGCTGFSLWWLLLVRSTGSRTNGLH